MTVCTVALGEAVIPHAAPLAMEVPASWRALHDAAADGPAQPKSLHVPLTALHNFAA